MHIPLLLRSRAIKQKNNQTLRENNEKMEHQAIQLMINNREKDKLFSIIAYDLKVPLFSLRQMLAALLLQQVVNDTIVFFGRQALEKKLELKNELPHTLTAWADRTMLEVLLRNLVSNSIKFCNPGDTITIQGAAADGVVEICVADTGIGIGQDILKKIALRESVTTFGTANEKGTGLGLLLCREFAEANQGLFRAESNPGKGSRFYFTLPLVPVS